ncbi:MAG: hypothetical protein JJE17_01740 [Peptostreptococcaceae bacterium]|nr:hypothetical protein [Peptostreptococcaceae bacterium]
MGILKKQINELDTLTNKLIQERTRIAIEKNKIQARINELRHETIKENTYRGKFDLESIESEASNEINSARLKKIQTLERILKQGDIFDTDYREAVINYINAIESDIKRLADERTQYIEESAKTLRNAETLSNELKKKAENTNDESAELLEPLAESVFTTSGGTLSGLYVLNKIKKGIQDFEGK